MNFAWLCTEGCSTYQSLVFYLIVLSPFFFVGCFLYLIVSKIHRRITKNESREISPLRFITATLLILFFSYLAFIAYEIHSDARHKREEKLRSQSGLRLN